jgi:hypothetical protein
MNTFIKYTLQEKKTDRAELNWTELNWTELQMSVVYL